MGRMNGRQNPEQEEHMLEMQEFEPEDDFDDEDELGEEEEERNNVELIEEDQQVQNGNQQQVQNNQNPNLQQGDGPLIDAEDPNERDGQNINDLEGNLRNQQNQQNQHRENENSQPRKEPEKEPAQENEQEQPAVEAEEEEPTASELRHRAFNERSNNMDPELGAGEVFDFDRLRTHPNMWRRLVYSMDQSGRMGSVFTGDTNPLLAGNQEEMNRLKEMAQDGKLFLRSPGEKTFQKINAQRDQEGRAQDGFVLGGKFKNPENRPYDRVLGSLNYLTFHLLRGIGFNKMAGWFEPMVKKYADYRAMNNRTKEEAIILSDMNEIKREKLRFRLEDSRKRTAELEKELEKSRRETQQLENQYKDVNGLTQDRTQAKQPGAKNPDAQLDAPLNNPAASKTEAQRTNLQGSQIEQQRLQQMGPKAENWERALQWQDSMESVIFQKAGEGVKGRKAEFARGGENAERNFRIGCFAGLVGRGYGVNGGVKSHENFVDALVGGKVDQLGNNYGDKLQNAEQEFRNAYDKAFPGNGKAGNKEALTKMLSNTIRELNKAALREGALSENMGMIGRHMSEVFRFASENQIQLNLTESEMTMAKGAEEMATLGHEGNLARQKLQQLGADGIDLNNPETAALANTYVTSRAIQASLQRDKAENLGYSATQYSMGTEAGNLSNTKAAMGKSLRQNLTKETLLEMVRDPDGVKSTEYAKGFAKSGFEALQQDVKEKNDLHLQNQLQGANKAKEGKGLIPGQPG